MKRHKQAVSHVFDLEPWVQHVFVGMELENYLICSLNGIDDAALDAIRGDGAVAMVEHDMRVFLVE